MILQIIMKDDEDKGSPFRDGANLFPTPAPLPAGRGMSEGQGEGLRKNRQISGSPSGVPSPVLSFPPNIKLCNNTTQVIARVKLRRVAIIVSLRATKIAYPNGHASSRSFVCVSLRSGRGAPRNDYKTNRRNP